MPTSEREEAQDIRALTQRQCEVKGDILDCVPSATLNLNARFGYVLAAYHL